LFDAQTTYSRSRYDYMLNVLQLQLATGTLNRADLEELNGWLKK
jgi:outer membrane protein TolC